MIIIIIMHFSFFPRTVVASKLQLFLVTHLWFVKTLYSAKLIQSNLHSENHYINSNNKIV